MRAKLPLLLPALSLLLAAPPLTAQDDTAVVDAAVVDKPDEVLVREAVLDYVEALYDVEPKRIEKSVASNLTKLGIARREASDPYRRLTMTFEQLVELAGKWNKEGKVPADAPKKAEVLGVYGDIACAKLTAQWGVDYMQLRREKDQWQICHVLWQRHPSDPPGSYEATAKDRAAVERAGMDYILGFYEADTERIDRSVSDEIQKFGYYRAAGATKARPMKMSFQELRGLAASLHANSPPADDAPRVVEVLDVLDVTAAVKVVGHWGVDYMHLTKVADDWKIEQVLWQSHLPEKNTKSKGEPGRKAGR